MSADRIARIDTFSIVKFRHATNGVVNTEEFGVPRDIKTDQPWIAEIPVGEGPWGVAAQQKRAIRIGQLSRDMRYSQAVRRAVERSA